MARASKLLSLAGMAAMSLAAAAACEARPRQVGPARPRAAAGRRVVQMPAVQTTAVQAAPDAGQGSAGATTTAPARPLVGRDGRPANGNVMGRSARGSE